MRVHKIELLPMTSRKVSSCMREVCGVNFDSEFDTSISVGVDLYLPEEGFNNLDILSKFRAISALSKMH